ncbi:hypothetical protein K432DRAFT_443739 [Lepidopterella palustris CBS 459.81]|uniref:WD40 repeat-like protein n=1 Tax=Lepidopterella palustris CBS 459.81 TaxID=1314670 RepID=A0A8E2JEG1_9PEZI|nr:hypothetical protein K432DRAFT_443739 [Lepidopterella palustris CBS 459.81]
MALISSIKSVTLDLPPSSLEFWPYDPQYAVIGTYNLEKNEESVGKNGEKNEAIQQRSGSLVLVRIDEDDITIIQTLQTPFAILDVHFCPPRHQNPFLLGAATSTGSLALYQLKKSPGGTDERVPRLKHVETLQYFPQSSLVTAFAWHPTISHLVGMTLSTGEVKLSSIKDRRNPHNSTTLYFHDLEAWTISFQIEGTGVFSGGDDSVLSFQSLPTVLSPEDTSVLPSDVIFEDEDKHKAMWEDRKTHGAGVTAILPLDDDILITGSYDDHIRIFHAPRVGRRTVLAEINLGGGVWRLKSVVNESLSTQSKQEDTVKAVLLASCMHAGTQILKVVKDGDGNWCLEVLAKFEEHKSMNYASDFQPKIGTGPVTYISTSFYDKLLCLWKA